MALLGLAWPAAQALTATEFFAKTSPSIWRVRTYDKEGLPMSQGSAVVVGPETLVTNCHVLAKSARFSVVRDNTSYGGTLEMWDTARDLCQIRARNLNAPAVAFGSSDGLIVGQTIYTLGNPQGLELTLSNGLISSLRRNEKNELLLIQISAPISSGSSGGGLFDEAGRLIGITTLGSRGNAQNLNFAVPVEWVKELPARHASLHPTTAAKPPSGPAPEPAAAVAAAPASAATGTSVDTAALDDVTRLPRASARVVEVYRTFLTAKLPRAFAISESGTGAWYSSGGKPPPAHPTQPADPSERALQQCEQRWKKCFLYAVDNAVVYKAPAEGR